MANDERNHRDYLLRSCDVGLTVWTSPTSTAPCGANSPQTIPPATASADTAASFRHCEPGHHCPPTTPWYCIDDELAFLFGGEGEQKWDIEDLTPEQAARELEPFPLLTSSPLWELLLRAEAHGFERGRRTYDARWHSYADELAIDCARDAKRGR